MITLAPPTVEASQEQGRANPGKAKASRKLPALLRGRQRLQVVDLCAVTETRQVECSEGPWAPWITAYPEFRWVLDPGRLVLVLGDPATGVWAYEVDLERCTTSAEVLARIAHVAAKGWVSNEILGSLVRALDEVLRFRTNLCGRELERGPIDVKAVVARTRMPQ